MAARKARSRKAKTTTSNGGRTSKFAGKKIVVLAEENPRREGTHGHKTFQLYKGKPTYEQVIAKGGRRQDVAFDLEKKYIKLVAA